MNDFYNTNSFVACCTLITGSIAFLIYFAQRRDSKQNSAKVLLTEIRIAEERLDQIRDKIVTNQSNDLPLVFITNSWKQYSHLFIGDFDQDELKLINNFYDYAEAIEDFAKRNNAYFWISAEERSKATTWKTSDFITEFMTDPDADKKIAEKITQFSNGMDKHLSIYSPIKTIGGIKDYLPKIQKITTSSCGTKLKKLAGF